MSAFWFEALGDVVGSHLLSTDLADLPGRRGRRRSRPRRPDHALPQGRDAARSSASCGATCPARRGRSTSTSGTMHGQRAARRACRSATSSPSPCSRPSTKATWPRREHLLRAGRRPRRRGARRAGPRHLASSSTRGAPRWRRERGIIIADTKFELGLVDGELVLCDEVLTPDSQPLLARRRVEARRHPAELRQAAGARLPRDPRLGQDAAAAAAAGRGRRRDERSRYLEAYERITGRRFADWPGVWTRASTAASRLGACCFSVLVETRLRPGIADPQGATIERSLPALGFDGVSGVRVGKAIRFDARGRRRGQRPRRRPTRCASGSSPTR